MGNTQVGKGYKVGLSGALLDTTSGTYYTAKINIQSVRVSTNGELDQIVAQDGDIKGLIATGDFLEATFEVIPEGATQADALTGCRIPARLKAFSASGFGNIPLGPFLNSGINTTGSSVTDTQPWIFISGDINGPANGKWSMTWVMRRFPSITNSTPIT